jgi:hypothetical protein
MRRITNSRPPLDKGQIMKTTTRWMTRLIAVCLSFAGFVHSAQATLVSTEQVAASEGVTSAAEQRAHVNELLNRADVAAALQERGIDMAQAQARIAALTDAEVAHLSHTLDTAPAGASDILGTIVFIFLLLLITDILGFTKIFPFTRSIR